MTNRKYILRVLSIILVGSGLLKLTAVGYVADVLFALLPLAWLNTVIAAHLGLVVIVISIFEITLGGMLLTSFRKSILYITGGYLLLMVLVNSYQLYEGVGDCGCLGGWVQLPPQITIAKTLLLLGCTTYLLLPHAFSRPSRRLIHQS